jgi:hypothetical protein
MINFVRTLTLWHFDTCRTQTSRNRGVYHKWYNNFHIWTDIGIVIAVFNAAVKNSSMLSLLPHYAEQHYFYLKNKYPQFIPNIEFFSRKSGDFYSGKIAGAGKIFSKTWCNFYIWHQLINVLFIAQVDVDGFFNEILQRIKTANQMSENKLHSEAIKIVQVAQRY